MTVPMTNAIDASPSTSCSGNRTTSQSPTSMIAVRRTPSRRVPVGSGLHAAEITSSAMNAVRKISWRSSCRNGAALNRMLASAKKMVAASSNAVWVSAESPCTSWPNGFTIQMVGML